jgi:SAM-dependent methyltransferase
MRVRDDPHHPDPKFADLYAALPEVDDLWPWLDWCLEADPPVLYLGIGTGRIASPLHRAGIEIVGVDAHPGMLRYLRERLPEVRTHQAVIETMDLGERFDLVIGPSSILAADINLAAAARHLRPGGRIGMEITNPDWLTSSSHEGIRFVTAAGDSTTMEVDYRLSDGSTVVQVIGDWQPGPGPADAEHRLKRLNLDLLWIGGRPEVQRIAGSPTYFVLAGRPA